MRPIEKDIDRLKGLLKTQADKGRFHMSENDEPGIWRDYDECQHAYGTLMCCSWDIPEDLMNEFSPLWQDDGLFSEEFIREMTVVAYSHKRVDSESDEKRDIEIPTYIYNF